MQKPSAQNIVRFHWSEDDKQVEILTNQLQSILDKLSAEEVGQIEEIIDSAYEKGTMDEADQQAGECL